jgi:hypothetical protein
MTSGNCIRNTQLSDLLKVHERAQTDRLTRNVRNFQNARHQHQQKAPEPKELATEEQTKVVTPATTPALASNLHELRTETIPLTLDEIEWLDAIVDKHRFSGLSTVFHHLVDHANTESPESKKKLFLQVRCRRCSAGAKGGVKRDRDIELSAQQWQWLENVQGRCKHASVGKTLRIMVDFYMPLCKEDSAFEQKLLRVDSSVTREQKGSEDVVKSVDAPCALAAQACGA